jgi:hypothetical protein
MVSIVCPTPGDVESVLASFRDRALLPSVDELRPIDCPLCRHLAHRPDERLGIVGHGTYDRQVLGYPELGDLTVFLRRYRCLGCGTTISVLPDVLLPWRWYAAPVIFGALWRHLVEEQRASAIRVHYGVAVERWRSLRRWRRELLVRLWLLYGARLGARGPARTRAEGRRRVVRLHAEALDPTAGVTPETAVRQLAASTAHVRGYAWPLGHDPPENLAV